MVVYDAGGVGGWRWRWYMVVVMVGGRGGG